MVQTNTQSYVTDEERREFLKVLGVAGVAAGGGLTLDELRGSMNAEPTSELAPVGQAIRTDLVGEVDAELIATQQAALAEAATELPVATERGVPTEAPRNEFMPVYEAAWPVYEHLEETGFFESTTEHLPEFSPSYLESAIAGFVGSEKLGVPLAQLGLTGTKGVDLLSTVIGNAEDVSDYYWLATDEIDRHGIEVGETLPSMTQMAMGGALLWIKDLDDHLWGFANLITEDIMADAVWHGQSMAAGLQLVSEGARVIGAETGEFSDSELGALLSVGFVTQAISQHLLPQDAYRISEEMRTERRTDLETVPAAEHQYGTAWK